MRYLAIDVRMAGSSGIGRYIRGFVNHLRFQKRICLLVGKKETRDSFPKFFDWVNSDEPIYSLQEQFAFLNRIKIADCLHSPHYNAPLLWNRKLIVTIHDLIHWHFPNQLPSPAAWFYSRLMLPAVLKKADAIIAVSEYTKQDVIRTFRVRPEKITVIHHGIDEAFLNASPKKDTPSSESKRYFLYVGLIKEHKNVGTLIGAFQSLKRRSGFEDLRLRLVGKADEKNRAVRGWLDLIGNDPSITHVDYLEDEALIREYRNALALAVPSHYEGFGFPLLEAMALEVPIIAARAASIPEVVGERAALFFDPNSKAELESRMKELLQNSLLRNQLILKGRQRASFFRWEEAAQKTAAVYESVLGTI